MANEMEAKDDFTKVHLFSRKALKSYLNIFDFPNWFVEISKSQSNG